MRTRVAINQAVLFAPATRHYIDQLGESDESTLLKVNKELFASEPGLRSFFYYYYYFRVLLTTLAIPVKMIAKNSTAV